MSTAVSHVLRWAVGSKGKKHGVFHNILREGPKLVNTYAMWLYSNAWGEVTPLDVQNCFQKSPLIILHSTYGIYGLGPDTVGKIEYLWNLRVDLLLQSRFFLLKSPFFNIFSA
jgi:hypothetical protein